MVSDNIVYSSNVKEYTSNKYIGDSDLFSGYLINGLLNNEKISTLLNQADNYCMPLDHLTSQNYPLQRKHFLHQEVFYKDHI